MPVYTGKKYPGEVGSPLVRCASHLYITGASLASGLFVASYSPLFFDDRIEAYSPSDFYVVGLLPVSPERFCAFSMKCRLIMVCWGEEVD
jgi:hypothetical protein